MSDEAIMCNQCGMWADCSLEYIEWCNKCMGMFCQNCQKVEEVAGVEYDTEDGGMVACKKCRLADSKT